MSEPEVAVPDGQTHAIVVEAPPAVGMFLTEMSDLLSVGLLFVVLVIGFVWHVRRLRRALTATVDRMFGAAGDAALEEMAHPMASARSISSAAAA